MLPKIQKFINNTKAIFKIDNKPTKGSNNLITSGAIYDSLHKQAKYSLVTIKSSADDGTIEILGNTDSLEGIMRKTQNGDLVVLVDKRTGQVFHPANYYIVEDGETFDEVTFTSYRNGIIYTVIITGDSHSSFMSDYGEFNLADLAST